MKLHSLIEKALFLKRIRLFNDLDFELLLAIGEKLHEEDYDAEEEIFLAGQAANRLYLIGSGTVELTDALKRPLTELRTCDFFGDESLFNDAPRAYGAICKTDATLFTVSRSHLLGILSECPTVAVALLQSYAQALPCRHTMDQFGRTRYTSAT
jgi:CRP-like cAMP-binding protein